MSYTNAVFAEMRDKMNEHFDTNMRDNYLFRVDCDTEELWNLYLNSFPLAIQKPWRERAWHDCQACKKWFRKLSNVVALTDDGKIITFFSCTVPGEYQPIFNVLEDFLMKNYNIKDIFLSSDKKIGHEHNLEQLKTGKILRHDHFFTILPETVIREGLKVGRDMSKARTNREVLERSLDSIDLLAVETVLELIEDNNLYRGKEWKSALETFKDLKKEYANISDEAKNNWCWLRSLQSGEAVTRIKNHSIGVLLNDLTDNIPIEDAVKRYEKVVAPLTYKRPKAIFTKKMLEDAHEKIVELGYENSLARRYAVIEDITVNDTIFVNKDLSKGIQGVADGLFDRLKDDAVVKKQDFSYATEIDLQTFIEEKLPQSSQVFLYTKDELRGNFVSLIAPVNVDAPSMFKWDNAFCWAYRNNVADSMKEQVKAMGGDVDVDLRFSIRWNNGDVWDKNDLDAHCLEPHGFGIFYMTKKSPRTKGWLDVDIINPVEGVPAVENIQYKDRNNMIVGDYCFRVNQYTYRGGDEGFEGEIEFDDKIYRFNYPYKINQDEFVEVACVTLNEDKEFSVIFNPELKMDGSNEKVWGVKLNDFIPVRLILYSPNYWGDNEVGNQHVFFMLQNCINDETPNAWFNEYLNNELNENRQVMEALGHEAKVELSDNQLSGMGFSVTRKNKITVKTVENNEEKIYNVVI